MDCWAALVYIGLVAAIRARVRDGTLTDDGVGPEERQSARWRELLIYSGPSAGVTNPLPLAS